MALTWSLVHIAWGHVLVQAEGGKVGQAVDECLMVSQAGRLRAKRSEVI